MRNKVLIALNEKLKNNNIEIVYNMEDFNIVLKDKKPAELAKMIKPYFNTNDSYFQIENNAIRSYKHLQNVVDIYSEIMEVA